MAKQIHGRMTGELAITNANAEQAAQAAQLGRGDRF
jgi:hypothetical protein